MSVVAAAGTTSSPGRYTASGRPLAFKVNQILSLSDDSREGRGFGAFDGDGPIPHFITVICIIRKLLAATFASTMGQIPLL